MALDWYPFYVVAYRRDTSHLTLAEHGAYRRLIDEYMTCGGPLPDNDRALAAIIGCTLDEWIFVAPAVRLFFEVSTKKLIHKRCEQELEMQQRLSTAKAEAGRRGGLERVRRFNELQAVLKQHSSAAQHTTLQVNITTSEFCSAGSLAPLADGELRSSAIQNGKQKIEPSVELLQIVQKKLR